MGASANAARPVLFRSSICGILLITRTFCSGNEEKDYPRRRCRGCRGDQAIARLLFYTGLRLSECVDLNVDDARISARKDLVIVRSGKGDTYREVPLNAEVHEAHR